MEEYVCRQQEFALGFTARWSRLPFVLITADLVKHDEAGTRITEIMDV